MCIIELKKYLLLFLGAALRLSGVNIVIVSGLFEHRITVRFELITQCTEFWSEFDLLNKCYRPWFEYYDTILVVKTL